MSEAFDRANTRRAYLAAERKQKRLMQRLLEILEPHAARDPVVVELCKDLAWDTEQDGLFELALKFAQLGAEGARQLFGPSHSRTRELRRLVREYQSSLKDG